VDELEHIVFRVPRVTAHVFVIAATDLSSRVDANADDHSNFLGNRPGTNLDMSKDRRQSVIYGEVP
jgi:hypothetical protein